MSGLQIGPVLAPSWGSTTALMLPPLHLDPLLFELQSLLLCSHCASVQMPLNENLLNCFHCWPRVSGWLKCFKLAVAKAKRVGKCLIYEAVALKIKD